MLPGIVSCIDSEYDLSNIASDDTMIGTSTSEFRIPVARITITAGKLGSTGENDNGSILELYREADTWLPSTLPGGAEAVEVERLSDDGAYLQSLLDGTFDEMRSIVRAVNDGTLSEQTLDGHVRRILFYKYLLSGKGGNGLHSSREVMLDSPQADAISRRLVESK